MTVDVSIDLHGRRVLVVGDRDVSRRVVARYLGAGARVERDTAGPVRDRLAALGGAEVTPAELPDLVVWVDGDPGLHDTVQQHASRLRAWFVAEAGLAPMPRGRVTLIGGGPGEMDLMTVAGRTALGDADVVLYDRLAPCEVMNRWAPGAELIDVGKTPGHHAVPQHEIEAIMVERALRGLHVVRLKGGDPFVFGRGGEEVLAARRAGVPITVIPGITSAISVPAAVGIPVTHREISRAFTVISGHVPFSDAELAHLVGLGGTVVILMGVNTLPHTVAGLQRHGMDPTIPLAIIERGYSIDQRTTVSSVGAVTELLGTVAPRSPAVIVIGDVVHATAWENGDGSDTDRIVRSVATLAT